MFTLEDAIAIAKPHADKVIAEGRVEAREAEIERLHAYIFALQGAASTLCALAEMDLDIGNVRPTDVRREVLEKTRALSRIGAQNEWRP